MKIRNPIVSTIVLNFEYDVSSEKINLLKKRESYIKNVKGDDINLDRLHPTNTSDELKNVILSLLPCPRPSVRIRLRIFENTSKVVCGLIPEFTEPASLLYGSIIEKVVLVKDCRTAEAIKRVENIFRNVNIALVNELVLIFEKIEGVYKIIAVDNNSKEVESRNKLLKLIWHHL